MPHTSRHKNYLLPVWGLLYLLTLGLLLSELDRNYYQTEKESLIKYSFRELFPHDTAALQTLSQRILASHQEAALRDDTLLPDWRAEAQRMLAGPGCVFRIRIVPRDDVVLLAASDPVKFDRLNRWSNTLFYRKFQNVVSYEIAGAADQPYAGLLSFHYTTPDAYPPVIALTHRYRLWSLLILVGVTFSFGMLFRMLVLPVDRVVRRVDAAVLASPRLMSRPRSTLERAYNDLARDAILLRLIQSLRDLSAREPERSRSTLMANLPGLLVGALDYRAAVLCHPSQTPSDSTTLADRVEAAADDEGRRSLVRFREQPLPMDALMAAQSGVPVECEEWMLAGLSQDAEGRCTMCLAVLPTLAAVRPAGEEQAWELATFGKLTEQLRDFIASLELQSRHVRIERSRANINLARNLGHDLTNIIATSKLDILTVQKILDRTDGEGRSEPEQDAMLRESVRGLSDSTRLLQEVVNIYRSFSYINRPNFETRNLNAVLKEMVEIFELSLPSQTRIEGYYGEDLPEWRFDPRLLKLALFNVLTNAVEAIKRRSRADDGVITIATGLDEAEAQIWISVQDTGPGICNADGAAATPAEIESMFREGVSTKAEDRGGGLGLSWVQTIIEDFHKGAVVASNRPEGGAEFVLRIGVVQDA